MILKTLLGKEEMKEGQDSLELVAVSESTKDAMEVNLSSAFLFHQKKKSSAFLVVFRRSGARLGFYWLCGRYFKTELVHTNCILACW
jgi:hypothetical protein